MVVGLILVWIAKTKPVKRCLGIFSESPIVFDNKSGELYTWGIVNVKYSLQRDYACEDKIH